MRNLLSAGFRRYFTSFSFWASFVIAILLSKLYREQKVTDLDDISTFWLYFVVIIVFVVSNVGREYEDGVFRNKLIAGYSKTKVYVSEVIMANVLTLIMLIVSILIVLPGNLYVAEMLPGRVIFKLILGFVLVYLMFATSVAVISLLLSTRVLSFVMLILWLIGTTIFAEEKAGDMQTEEFFVEYEYEMQEIVAESGNVFEVPVEIEGSEKYVKNPKYVGGIERFFYENALKIMPAGQLWEYYHIIDFYWDKTEYKTYMNLKEQDNLEQYEKSINREPYRIPKRSEEIIDCNIIYACISMLAFTALGAFIFKKVDFK